MITADYLNDMYEYKDGCLYYKKLAYKNTKAIGDNVGYIAKSGYITTKIKNKSYLLHRLIYLMHYNYLPEQIDHIDGNPVNNLIENLRDVTGSQNCMNKKLSKINTSGYKNIHFIKKINKYRVQIKVKGKPLSFGCYEDVELADLVAQEVRDKYFGKFARHC
jgi:hypothetical protein